jgi:hypothetical protein
VNPGFSGKIGLPYINKTSSVSYAEYRTTSLTLAGGTAVINAPSVQRCNLAFGSNTTTLRVLNTGNRVDTFTPVVLLTGGNGSSELDITKGDVGVAYLRGTTATFPTINTGFANSAPSDVTLICGPGATLTTVNQNGGSVTVQSAVTTANVGIMGGTLIIQDGSATTVNALNGTVNVNTTGTVATINLFNSSTLNFDADPRSKTVTNPIAVNDVGVTVKDNQKTVNSGTLTLALSSLNSWNVQHGGNLSAVYT